MKRANVVRRALDATKLGVRYRLGNGGMNPAAKSPADAKGLCDCSGFTAWVLGFPRLVKDPFYLRAAGGWVNTTSIVKDADDPRGFFQRVALKDALPGDLIVFPWSGGKPGHVGVITQVKGGQLRVVHCSPRNERMGLSAIAETGPAAFERRDTIIARYTGLED